MLDSDRLVAPVRFGRGDPAGRVGILNRKRVAIVCRHREVCSRAGGRFTVNRRAASLRLAVDPVTPPAVNGLSQSQRSSTAIHGESPTGPRADFNPPADDREPYPIQNADPSRPVTSAETDRCDEPVAIQHGTSGTVVTGTTRDDTVMRDALKAGGFKWSRAQGFWYLPRSMHQHTRTLRVDQLTSAAGRAGRNIPVLDHAEDGRTPGVDVPQVVMAARASDACPAQSCAVDLTP